MRNSPRRRGAPRERRGAALFLVLFFTLAVGALALSAIFLSTNASLVTRSYDRESTLRYGAEAGLALGKSRLNFDPKSLPDTGYKTLLSKQALVAADGTPIPGLTVDVYAGPSGSTSGQFGQFASVVAVSHDKLGNESVRRLELSQESFAKFAYWSDKESNGTGTIYFGNGDQLWGPVFSNDVISIASSGATFHDQVATASSISGAGYGTFLKGYQTAQKRIDLPTDTKLAKLAGYAALGNMSFTAPNNGNESNVRMRIEFVAVDLNGDGDSTDVDEGFFKVYTTNGTPGINWLRADWPGNSSPAASTVENCGDWHTIKGVNVFFPAAVHGTTWYKNYLTANGITTAAAGYDYGATIDAILKRTSPLPARCFLGGDPHLVGVARSTWADPTQGQRGGEDSTFSATDKYGSWKAYPGPIDPRLQAKRPWDAAYLFPIYRGINSGSKGVIYVSGTTGISGVLRGKITLYATGSIVVLDDERYANDPGLGSCQDILGLIAGNDVVLANNAINTPPSITKIGYKVLDDTKDLYLQSVIMALNTSFRVETYNGGPSNATTCEGLGNGRGCLYLTGGIIQESRGPVGLLSGEGYIKRYSYDRCAAVTPPPYFPTTGRYTDNRYFELSPVGFDPTTLFKSLTPAG